MNESRKLTNWVGLCLLFGPLFALVWPPAYTLAPLCLSITAIVLLLRHRALFLIHGNFDSFRLLAWVIWTYVFVSVSIDLYHGYSLSSYEKYVPFILYPFLLWLFIWVTPKVVWIWAGAVCGAWLGLFVSLYQILFLGVDRASVHGSAISFGNAGVLLGAASLFAWFYWPSRKKFLHHVVLLGAAFAGVGTSLLSGSKGGWISIITLGVIFFIKVSKEWSSLQKLVAAFFVIGVFAGAISIPGSPVVPRVQTAINGFVHWKETGMDADGSVGARLNIWEVGVRSALDNPLIGIGASQLKQRFQQASENGFIDPKWREGTHMHNEVLNTYIHRGLLGLLAAIAVYAVAAKLFWSYRRHDNPVVAGLAMMGLTTLLLYAEFGLSDIVWPVNANRQLFLFWVLTCAGMIYAHTRALSSKSP